MVALKHERRVLLLTTTAKSYPPSAPAPTLPEVLDALQKKFVDGKSRIHLAEGGSPPIWGLHRTPVPAGEEDAATNALYIADLKMDHDRELVSILVNRGDPEISDQAFINSLEEDVKSADRPEGYAPGRSAHMVIGFGEKFKTPHGHRMVLEKANGIPRSTLFNYFNLLVREASEEQGLSYEKKVGEQVSYRHRLSHNTYAGKSLAEDLKNGYVTSLELIDTNFKFAGADTNDDIKKVTRRLRMSVERTNKEHKVMQFIEKLRNFAKDADYNQMQVHLSTAQDETASPKFSIEKQEAADLIYARIETISGFKKELDAAYAKLSEDIESKLIEKLEDADEWPI